MLIVLVIVQVVLFLHECVTHSGALSVIVVFVLVPLKALDVK